MKYIIIALFSIFSVSAYACPLLEGQYSCIDQNNEQFDESIVQFENEFGDTEYYFSEDTFITDGIERTEDLGNGDSMTSSSSCSGTTLNVDMYQSYPSDGFYADVKAKVFETTRGYTVTGIIDVVYEGESSRQTLKVNCTRAN